MNRTRATTALAVGLVLGLAPAAQADDFKVEMCAKILSTGSSLGDCRDITVQGGEVLDYLRVHWVAPEQACDFPGPWDDPPTGEPLSTVSGCFAPASPPLFATSGGEVYSARCCLDKVPLAPLPALNYLTIWYDFGDFETAPNTEVHAIDLTNDSRITFPVVEDLHPSLMSHPCFEETPCNIDGCADFATTDYEGNVELHSCKVTAQRNPVASHTFDRWFLLTPSGLQFTSEREISIRSGKAVAFYLQTLTTTTGDFEITAHAGESGSAGGIAISMPAEMRRERSCLPFPYKKCNRLKPKARVVTTRRPTVTDLERLCWMLSGGTSGCPGCGPKGECNPWEMRLAITVPAQVVVVNVRSKKEVFRSKIGKQVRVRLPGGPLDQYRIAIVPKPGGSKAPSTMQLTGEIDVGPFTSASKRRLRK